MNLIKQYSWWIISLAGLGMLAFLVFSYLSPVMFDASLSFTINRTNRQETAEYQYDGYYAIQASDLFSQTVVSWMMTPSVLLEIYQKAGIDPEVTTLNEISSRFKVKKYSSQNIVVLFTERDRQTSEQLSLAITEVVEKMARESNQSAESKSLFEVVGNKPVIVETSQNVLLNALVGLLAGVIAGFVAAYLMDIFKKKAEPQF